MKNVNAIYQVFLYDKLGNRLAFIDSYRSLQFQSVVNDSGFFMIVMNGLDPKRTLFEVNGIIEIQRKIAGITGWQREFVGHIETFQRNIYKSGNQQFTAIGPGINGRLAQRVIAYNETTAEAAKVAPAETVMKEYTNENLGALALTSNGRFANANLLNFSIDTDLANGDVWSGDRCGKNLLKVLQEISDFSNIDFSIDVDETIGNYIFKTYPNQLGSDRTTSGLDPSTGKNAAGNAPHVFAPERGNVQESLVEIKHIKERNRVYVYGQGAALTRQIEYREKPDTFDVSNYINLREVMRGGGSQATAAQLQSQGDELLERFKTYERFEFLPADTLSSLYGVHYFLGDRVTVKVGDIEADKKIISAMITLAGGKGESSKVFNFEDISR